MKPLKEDQIQLLMEVYISLANVSDECNHDSNFLEVINEMVPKYNLSHLSLDDLAFQWNAAVEEIEKISEEKDQETVDRYIARTVQLIIVQGSYSNGRFSMVADTDRNGDTLLQYEPKTGLVHCITPDTPEGFVYEFDDWSNHGALDELFEDYGL
jgi:hypothetical protein